jgi:hypothetical protein
MRGPHVYSLLVGLTFTLFEGDLRRRRTHVGGSMELRGSAAADRLSFAFGACVAVGTAACGGHTGAVGAGPTADDGSVAGGSFKSDASVDTSGDATLFAAPSTADASSDGQPVAVGCPEYQSLCSGVCIATSEDPKNCGGCGTVCPATQACSAGICSGSCTTPPSGGSTPITKCGQRCVDTFNDNHDCGMCGYDCTTSQRVCVGGACAAPGVTINSGGKACPNGGAPINIVTGSTPMCAGSLAETTFRWGLCSCGNVSLVNSGQSWAPTHPGLDVPALYVDAYDSTKGPSDPNNPELGGSVGVNGTFTSKGGASTFMTGAMWAASSVAASGPTDVKEELHAAGPITTGGAFNVGQPNSAGATVSVSPGTASWDGFVAGNIAASGAPMTFYKDLTAPPGTTRSNVVVKGTVHNGSVSVAPPCDSCGSTQINVAQIVDHYASAANNDNAAIGLAPGALTNVRGDARLDLPCGYYYLDGISAKGSVTIYAHGHTALFLGGDVSANVASFTLDSTATFDVFVKGTITTQADLIVGNPNYAALSRTYVAGSGLGLNGEAHISGLLYASNSNIEVQSHLTVYGAIYCQNFNDTGDNTDIHYDRSALKLDTECCPPGGASPQCPNTPPPTCQSCKDCGNQACVQGSCGPCSTSADCCSPLVCQSGTCVPILR